MHKCARGRYGRLSTEIDPVDNIGCVLSFVPAVDKREARKLKVRPGTVGRWHAHRSSLLRGIGEGLLPADRPMLRPRATD